MILLLVGAAFGFLTAIPAMWFFYQLGRRDEAYYAIDRLQGRKP